jgi:hypothetical protein
MKILKFPLYFDAKDLNLKILFGIVHTQESISDVSPGHKFIADKWEMISARKDAIFT